MKETICPVCKKKLPEGVTLCVYCGQFIPANYNKRMKKRVPVKISAFFVCIVLIGICAVINFYGGFDFLKNSNPLKEKTVSKQDYISSCKSVPYDDLIHYPNKHINKKAFFTGKVIQVQDAALDDSTVYGISTKKDEYDLWVDDIIYVEYKDSEISEGDIVNVYGVCQGKTTFAAVFGNTLTVPEIKAEYIDIVD